jgi:hypothetical protein
MLASEAVTAAPVGLAATISGTAPTPADNWPALPEKFSSKNSCSVFAGERI